ncbi:MurR/RpiR family transcriptional regulator [Lacticigenium naphthae]|uniref:MurR/RpiR family transcriptional regulator n=1 Tax=Lacticigenium naphthae TaxID=515351 RepID=UPI0003FED636|nr:MurR/RpiR family transcriptional regulator [Lacticigenium naphthae]
MNNVLLTIREKESRLPKSERKIAQFILGNAMDVISMNASTLANKADSSAAAVIRFCHSLGLKGFTDLKLQLSANMSEIREDIHTDITYGDPIEMVKRKFLLNTQHTFYETNDALDEEILQQINEIIHESPVIFVYGLGSSSIAGQDLQQKFSRLGKIVMSSTDQHYLAASLKSADKNALFIAISNTGEKKETLALATLAKKMKVKVVSVTHLTDNPLANLADYALKTAPSKEAPLRSGATLSVLMQLYALDILFLTYVTTYYEESFEVLEKSKDALSDFYAIMERTLGKNTVLF